MCPHHQCSKCLKKRGAAGGLLFPCHGCAYSFCEDCLPQENVTFLDRIERFDKRGFDSTKQNVYINCSLECEKYTQMEFGYIPRKLNQKNQGVFCPAAIDLSGHFGSSYDINEEVTTLDAEKNTTSGRVKRNVARVNYTLGRPSKSSNSAPAIASNQNQTINATPKFLKAQQSLGSKSKSTTPSTTATDVSSETSDTSSYCSVVDLTGMAPNSSGTDANHAIELD